MNPAPPALPVRLLFVKSTRTVLFLEANKKFVDALLSLLLLPMGSVVNLVRGATGMHDNELGAIANLHGSVIDKLELEEKLLVAREVLTNPAAPLGFPGTMLAIQPSGEMPSFLPKVYKCSSSQCRNFGTVINQQCSCGGYCSRFTEPVTDIYKVAVVADPAAPPHSGYVKDNVEYMITDGLEVFPTSTVKSIMLLVKNKVENMGDLGSIEIMVTRDWMVKILRRSLVSKTVLNDVFKADLPAGTSSPA
ncbi:hypothetical protein SELMODRAFT_431033 [Selaginella moellendorffii]|uniref:Uncharacterized protein n=1 Tax=Selaginella moellendorffii TaxID=88036 RepID=D8TBB0_SELML|nr:hypothetical protein SELMODRAFT_431033 [Selaginella moellendorffii]